MEKEGLVTLEALVGGASPLALMFVLVTGIVTLATVGPTTSPAAPAASSAVPSKTMPPPVAVAMTLTSQE